VIDRSGKKNVPRKMPAVQRLSEPICEPLRFRKHKDTIKNASVASSRRHAYGQVAHVLHGADELKDNQTSANAEKSA